MGCEEIKGIRFFICETEEECLQLARGRGDIVFIRGEDVVYFALDGVAIKIKGELIKF